MLSFLLLWGATHAATASAMPQQQFVITDQLRKKYQISTQEPTKIPDNQVVLQIGKEGNAVYLTISRKKADEFYFLRDMLKGIDEIFLVGKEPGEELREGHIVPLFEECSVESALTLLEWTPNSPPVTDLLVFRLAKFYEFKGRIDLYRKNLQFIFSQATKTEGQKEILFDIKLKISYEERCFLLNPKENPMKAYCGWTKIKKELESKPAVDYLQTRVEEFRGKYFTTLDEIGDDGVVPEDKLYVVIPHDRILDPKVNSILNLKPDIAVVIDFGDQTQIPDFFLKFNKTIKNIIFEGAKITTIGSNFLFDCNGLTSIDLSPLSNVTSIGDFFLTSCSGLTR